MIFWICYQKRFRKLNSIRLVILKRQTNRWTWPWVHLINECIFFKSCHMIITLWQFSRSSRHFGNNFGAINICSTYTKWFGRCSNPKSSLCAFLFLRQEFYSLLKSIKAWSMTNWCQVNTDCWFVFGAISLIGWKRKKTWKKIKSN